MSFGVYVHFPYCPSKCPYCDFAVKVVEVVPHRRYARAISRELAWRRAATVGRRAVSLYIGGGTPSMWEPSALGEVLTALRTAIPVAPDAEITLEANPGASDARRFAAYRALGVNRLSIGVQSFDPRVLAGLGRRHTGSEAERAYFAAREAGLDNLTLDFIFGAPGQELAVAVADVARAAALGPEHLSCYALTLEGLAEDVTLAKQVRRGRVRVPDDEVQSEMGYAIREELGRRGYLRYEISNFARDGKRSRHNSLYWRGEEYLGLGCGACGFSLNDPADPSKGGRRYGNHRSPDRYLAAVEAGQSPEDWSEELTAGDLFRERMIIGLRMVEGVTLGESCRTFGVDPNPVREGAARLVARGLATLEGDVLALTERGLDFHSEASMEFV